MASSNGDLLFIRKAEVIIGPRVSFSNGPVEPPDARKFGAYVDYDGTLKSGIRIKFEIEKDDSSNANKAKISLYNISVESRAFLEKKNLVIFLNVGYADFMRNVFFGDVKRIEEKRDSADIVTILECGDAETTLRESYIQVGLNAGCTNIQIIDQVVKQLNLPVSYKTEIKSIKYNQGFSYSGLSSKLLDQLTKHAGIKWTVQDGEIIFSKTKESDNLQTEAPLISAETGLLSIPTKDDKGVKFECLINPSIRPIRAVKVESKKFLSGQSVLIKVLKADYDGDTHDGDWKMKIEGEVIK